MFLFRRLWNVARSRAARSREIQNSDPPPLDMDEGLEDDWEGAKTFEEGREEAGSDDGHRRGGARPAGGADDSDIARFYANLEIPVGSDLETTRQAWRRLMKRYHPDLHGADPRKREIATEITKELTRAYREIEKMLREQG